MSLVASLCFLQVDTTGTEVIDKNSSQVTGSLWSNEAQNPLTDRTARRQGDLITVLISESSVASFSAATSASKSTSGRVVQDVFKSLFGFLDPTRARTSNGETESDGKGTTTQNGSLRARLTAEVVEVTPRGHLIVEGTRKIVVNRETQLFRLNGIIRRDDINPDNTVLSENIAQAEIRLEGRGQIADKQRRGILTQLLDWLF